MLLPPILGLIPKEHYCFNLGTSQINYFYRPNVSLIQIGTQLIHLFVILSIIFLILQRVHIFNNQISIYILTHDFKKTILQAS